MDLLCVNITNYETNNVYNHSECYKNLSTLTTVVLFVFWREYKLRIHNIKLFDNRSEHMVAGQLGPWTTRPVDSLARSRQLDPYVPDNSARK